MDQGSGEFEPFLQRTLRREHERQRKVITALVIVIVCALAAGILLSLLLLDLQKVVDDLSAGPAASSTTSDPPEDENPPPSDVAGLRAALERLEVGLFGSEGATDEGEDLLGRLARQIDRTQNSLARRDAAITCLSEAVTRLDEGLGRLLTRDLSAEDYINNYEIPDCD
ncbi:MAG TPA: hypothetical protein VFS18_03785 [Actinomycetota bacterium]|nr:hypothetical protein [Actinomycetota bacterium]